MTFKNINDRITKKQKVKEMETYEKIDNYSNNLGSDEMLKIGRLNPNAFTRKGKMGFKKMGYFILNKRGVTLSMEIDNFKDVIGDEWEKVTESAICQQRKNFNPEVFKELNRRYIIDTYDNPKDYKTYKGYLVFAIDGMDIELPNVPKLREEFGYAEGRKGQRIAARATTSSIYDVVNNMMVDSQITKYKTSERELARKNVEEMLQLLGEQKKIIIFDRGYPSLELIEYLDRLEIKYLFRVGENSYKKERDSMKTEDEVVGIKVTTSRLQRVKSEKDKEILKEKREIKARFVKYKLETGEVETLITNLSKEEFDRKNIGEMYYARWKIELAYDIAKNKLNIENISGQSKVIVEQEFYAQMSLLNIAEDLSKEASKKIVAKKENGYKYDYKPNMNILVGQLRKRFILIVISMVLNRDEEAKQKYYELIEEISSHIVPIRPNRKNRRIKYKGYNKNKQNLRRNS